MLRDKKTAFIGGGQMCEAILAGALKAGALQAQNTYITDVSAQRLTALRDSYGVNVQPNEDGAGARQLAETCDVVVLSIKPQYAKKVVEDAAGAFGAETLVISILGGTPLATLEGWLPACPVVRVMPNTPMLVGKGCAGIAAGSRATAEHITQTRELFDAVGKSWVVEEKLIDPLTAVSGCGPAFACLFMEALADGGVEQGLPRDMALELAAQTLAGTAELLLGTGRHPGQLKDSVCSPGGGTIAGVHALEDGAFRATVMNAVAASRRRMEDVGRESGK